jgi:hypothetical protein
MQPAASPTQENCLSPRSAAARHSHVFNYYQLNSIPRIFYAGYMPISPSNPSFPSSKTLSNIQIYKPFELLAGIEPAQSAIELIVNVATAVRTSSTVTAPSARFIVETNPAFTNERNFLSSAYFLQQLNLDVMSTSPNPMI